MRHFHLDHLGTPRLITDAARNGERHDYAPFGREVTAPGSERMKFTGHERNGDLGDVNGLDAMHARFYGAGVGRFVSVDPVLDINSHLERPQGWNRYTYVMNNPVRWTDPTGKVIQYDDRFQQYKKTDPAFRAAFWAWKSSRSGFAQWKAMGNDTNTVYRFTVGRTGRYAGLVFKEGLGSTKRPGQSLAVTKGDENKQGKLDADLILMTINVDFIKSSYLRIPELQSREIAKNIFHEATHGLDLGLGTRSAREANAVDPQWKDGIEPRLNLFERELNRLLPLPEWWRE